MALTERERITLLMMRGYGDRERSFREVRDLFNAEFRQGRQGISVATVLKTCNRFQDTGCVRDRQRSGRPKIATNEDNSIDILQSFVEDPNTSTRKAAQAHDCSYKSVQRVLKNSKFHPYKINLVQELVANDFDCRLEFCDIMMQKIDDQPEFHNKIVFLDEATFMLNGSVNRHNSRYWSDSNPHWMRESKSQYPQKLNVWAGIVGEHIIGPFFIDGNLTAQKYEAMLRDDIVPTVRNIFDPDFDSVWFQQDGAPHFSLQMRNFLNNTFPERWIGRRGAIEWPPRSSDLSPLDFFFWGYLKDRVYKIKPQNLNDLQVRIIDEVALITPEILQNVQTNFYDRLAHCQTVEGRQFEHLL